MAKKNLPLEIKNVTLMSPGTWNDWNYDVGELRKAYSTTDWSDEHVTSLFLDHPDNPHNAASSWIGRVKNHKQLQDGTVKGDLEIWDENVIFKLTKAKAGFGVSPRVIGQEDLESKSFTDFVFDNFSVVAKPAQSTAMIQLSRDLKFNGVVRQLSKEESRHLSNTKHMEIMRKIVYGEKITEEDREFIKGMIGEECSQKDNYYDSTKSKLKKKKLKGGKNMSEEEKTAQETESSEESEESNESEENTEKSEDSEEKSEELSDADVLSIMNEDLDGFNSYANDIRANNPSISLKDLAKKYKSHKEKMNFVEGLSESEATILLKKLLNKIGVNDLSNSKKEKKDSVSQELASKLSSLEKSIKDLSAKKKVPAPKTSVGPQMKMERPHFFGEEASEGVQELAKALRGY